MTVKRLIEEEDHFHLAVFEALGCLVLMLHWHRGIVDALVQNGRIELSGNEKTNWDRVIVNLSNCEQQVWEIVPSRLMIATLREYRKTGQIDIDKIDLILKQDTHGRIPYGLSQKDLDDLDDILRKLKDARIDASYGHANSLLKKEV